MADQTLPARPPRLRSRLPDKLRIRAGVHTADRPMICSSCGQPNVVLCDACERELPSTWLRYPRRNIFFLGMNGMGKSTLLATSKAALSQRNGLVLTPLDMESTAERFYSRYTQPLLESNDHVPHTQAELPEPFLWGVTNQGSSGPASTLALAVYDVPGELLLSHRASAPIVPMLNHADAAVLVINPATLPALYDRCGQAPDAELAPDTWERAERILDELLRHQSIGQASRMSIAVVFTHLDQWFAALGDCPSTSMLTDSYLRHLVQRWHGGTFLSRLAQFTDSRLFATGLYRSEAECRPLNGADAAISYLLRRFGLPMK